MNPFKVASIFIFENLTFTIYNPFIKKPYYRFQEQDEYSLWLNSKCNVRHCDVLVQNKTSDSLNYFALYRIFV
ncbi:hypothetical protein ECZU36_00060 [Escherichia coli]|nr:hypothetical protein ECZU36_00060 [Escherichia coli]